jgi:hypothetical protein
MKFYAYVVFLSLLIFALVRSLIAGTSASEVLGNLAVLIIIWYWFIFPYLNNKSIHMPGYSVEYNGTFYSKLMRLIFFVTGLYCYFVVICRMVF